MDWHYSESTIKPKLVEKTGTGMLYVRKNIKETEREGTDGSTVTMFTYEEAKVSPEDYGIYLHEQQQLLTDYLEMIAEE